MSQMIPVDNYDAHYVDDKTRDWHPCRVIGVSKGEKLTAMEFVIIITKYVRKHHPLVMTGSS